jgi:hypothetical protein
VQGSQEQGSEQEATGRLGRHGGAAKGRDAVLGRGGWRSASGAGGRRFRSSPRVHGGQHQAAGLGVATAPLADQTRIKMRLCATDGGWLESCAGAV